MKLKEIMNRKVFSGKLSVLALLLLLVVFTVSGTVAYMIASSSQVTNTFVPGNVTCEVQETFNKTTKENVTIKNTGNVDAYIRAVVVVNWVDADGNVCAASHTAPTINYNSANWTKEGDFYYFNNPVAPGASTTNLIDSATSVAQADGCKLQIEIIASAIQAEGTGATGATDAWSKVPAGN